MTSEPATALRELRDLLRTPIPDVDTFVFALSMALQAISLHPTSSTPICQPLYELKAIERYLPTIQTLLLTHSLPTFLHVLDERQHSLLARFFGPPRTDAGPSTLHISRSVALVSYQTLPTFLSSPNQLSPLPSPCRTFLLDSLEKLAREYSVDDVYWAVWAGSKDDDERWRGVSRLKWEEAVKSLGSVPGKTANAVGRWKADGWAGDVPSGLVPRPYFDRVVVRLEAIMYELFQDRSKHDGTSVRYVIQRLASLGLLTPRPSEEISPSPLLLSPLLPPIFAHLHPPPASSLPPYPVDYLPSIFLPLPASTLFAFVDSLLVHLAFRLIPPAEPLLPDRPGERIYRAVDVLERIIGRAEAGKEAWEAVLRVALGKRSGDAMDLREHVRTRLIVGWVAGGGKQAIKAFIDAVVDIWTDAKHVKFSLYAQQFHLTHIFLLVLSLLPPYDPYLVNVAHRARVLLALQSYLAHPDASIRRLGMLVAEVLSDLSIEESNAPDSEISENAEIEELKAGLEADDVEIASGRDAASMRTGKKGRSPPNDTRRLRFGKEAWVGNGQGKEECRWLRSAVGVRDRTAVIRDDATGEVWMLGWTIDAAPQKVAPRSVLSTAYSATGSPQTRGRAHSLKRRKPASKPKIVMLSDDQLADPLEGYIEPSPSSSRSPSPTPSYLEEVAGDPSLALDGAEKRKIIRPVYIGQLIQLLKEREKPDHLEMALKWGAGLIRAKRGFGTELAENAVTVATYTIALNDPFNLEDFETRRQGILTALVACAPRQTAPFLAEQYFSSQYSLQQKSVLLTAMAMGARELAGMPTLLEPAKTRRIDFPSKVLPPNLHRKYIGPADGPAPAALGDSKRDQLEDAIDGVRGLLLSKGAKRGEEAHPELAREKRLKLGTTTRRRALHIAEVGSLSARQADEAEHASKATASGTAHGPVVPFAEVAAEYFIMPLINRFWQHFQDAGIRESRALASGNRFRGAGTGLVLSPMSLEKVLMTLSLLMHAARHASVFLSILSPEALELAMTIGMRHPPESSNFIAPDDDDAASVPVDGSRLEAQVLGSALELALVSLDGASDLDGGRTLAVDKPELVLAVGEWASRVFEGEHRGGAVAAGRGSRGGREGRVRATAAGVVVKVAEMGERWGHLGLPRSR